jgi:hypothetical protein
MSGTDFQLWFEELKTPAPTKSRVLTAEVPR